MTLDMNYIRNAFAAKITANDGDKGSMDAALFHVVRIAFEQGRVAPQQADKVRELENALIVTRNEYGTMVTGLPNYVDDYLTPLEFVLRNGELADCDIANRLQELHVWLEALKGERLWTN